MNGHQNPAQEGPEVSPGSFPRKPCCFPTTARSPKEKGIPRSLTTFFLSQTGPVNLGIPPIGKNKHHLISFINTTISTESQHDLKMHLHTDGEESDSPMKLLPIPLAVIGLEVFPNGCDYNMLSLPLLRYYYHCHYQNTCNLTCKGFRPY